MPESFLDFGPARRLTLAAMPRTMPRSLDLAQLGGLVLAAEVRALVDSPSLTAASKDGFAVHGAELAQASPANPVALALAGSLAAGQPLGQAWVGAGQALRVTTGASLPPGADAVLAGEFARQEGGRVLCFNTAPPGKNLLLAGSDAAQGQVLAQAGQVVTPALAGLLAAAGLTRAQAHPLPLVGLLAVGREVVAPGQPLPPGAVYASNLVCLAAWLGLHGLASRTLVVDDQAGQIGQAATELLASCDALVTSGGAWLSERDLVVGALGRLGMELVYRRVRMGPGKGVALGLLAGKPVFCLPGGPPSNQMAFLQLALPGLLAVAGHPEPGLAEISARLAGEVGGEADWTQFFQGRLEAAEDGPPWFHPLPLASRLQALADAQAILCLAQGQERLEAGALANVQVLGPAWRRRGF